MTKMHASNSCTPACAEHETSENTSRLPATFPWTQCINTQTNDPSVLKYKLIFTLLAQQ